MKPRAFRRNIRRCLAILAGLSIFGTASASAATVVALGASNTYGKGVARNQAYPAQLEAILRAKGLNFRVVNAGINGDTTEGMLQRLDRAVPNGASTVILAETMDAKAARIAPWKSKAACAPGVFR